MTFTKQFPQKGAKEEENNFPQRRKGAKEDGPHRY